MAVRGRRSRGESVAFWRRQIRLWQRSGQTISGFCREEGLTESTFHFWKRRLGVARPKAGAKKRAVDKPRPTLLPVSVTNGTTAPLVLEMGGATLHIGPGADAQLLRTVLESLKAG